MRSLDCRIVPPRLQADHDFSFAHVVAFGAADIHFDVCAAPCVNHPELVR